MFRMLKSNSIVVMSDIHNSHSNLLLFQKMKKVYLEKRCNENYDTELPSFSMNDTDFQTINAVMEEEMGLEDLDTLIQLELDNYSSCFGDMLNVPSDQTEIQKNFYVDEESPTHSDSYEYIFPEPMFIDNINNQPVTTSGRMSIYYYHYQVFQKIKQDQETLKMQLTLDWFNFIIFCNHC